MTSIKDKSYLLELLDKYSLAHIAVGSSSSVVG